MLSSAELIQYLRRRARTSLRPERPPGEFPPGWQAWFSAMGERIGAVTGASAPAIIAIFVQRELAVPSQRVGELNRWQSFGTLWRQDWHPPEPEDRGVRMVAWAVTLLIHLFLVVVLLWLAYVRFMGVPVPAAQGEAIVQVEYIGEGTPLEQGGGPQAGDRVEPVPAASAPASDAARATPPPQPAEPQPSPSDAPFVQQPQPAAQVAQPLQVTQSAAPEASFELAPTTPLSIQTPRPTITVPVLQQPAPAMEIVEVPLPAQPVLTTPEVTAPSINPRIPEVAVREAPSRLPPVRLPALTTVRPALAAPSLRPPAPQAEPGQSATPSRETAAVPATGSTPTPAPAGTAPATGGEPAADTGVSPAATATGSGQLASPKPGARPTPGRSDDWGESTRNRPGGSPGGKPGLFNPDGSPRLPEGMADTGGGLPPGTIQEDIADLDRAGTWLKRAPYDYEPTFFDRFWRPHETLLEEWVRRGIKQVSIPIPGTSKKLTCVVSLLQLGGGCGLLDPNLNNQPARARPPPDIPFKPELQEDQGNLDEPAQEP